MQYQATGFVQNRHLCFSLTCNRSHTCTHFVKDFMKFLPSIEEKRNAVQSNAWTPKTYNVLTLLLIMTSCVRNSERTCSRKWNWQKLKKKEKGPCFTQDLNRYPELSGLMLHCMSVTFVFFYVYEPRFDEILNWFECSPF